MLDYTRARRLELLSACDYLCCRIVSLVRGEGKLPVSCIPAQPIFCHAANNWKVTPFPPLSPKYMPVIFH